MPAEAMVELRAVVALSPGSVRAPFDALQLEASEETPLDASGRPGTGWGLAARRPCPRSRGAIPYWPRSTPRPSARPQRDLGVSGLPVIFNLPPAVAIKRAELFARDVHPILQTALLVAITSNTRELPARRNEVERGLSGDALRANLDATLRLVDSENPARSELLSNSLVPHGNRPNPRPIFRSCANDPRYQIIAAWVNSLRATCAGDACCADPRSGAATGGSSSGSSSSCRSARIRCACRSCFGSGAARAPRPRCGWLAR